ncbi:MAG TPA: hypothetical protein DD490_20660 [Acidobacteria bacterium]|nr:hypothetical protein [Acidobacteriota bacterium]
MDERTLASRILAVLLEAVGWPANKLAGAMGVTPGTIYDYLRGKPAPSRAVLERVAATMGLPASHVDRARRFVLGTEMAAGHGSRAEQEIDRFADEIGIEWGEMYRAKLLRSERLAQALMDRMTAETLFPRLRALTPEERVALVQEKKPYQSWAVGELACHESIEAAARDADEALAWAALAVQIAGLAEGDPAFLLRNEGYARFHLGNAIRVKGQSLPAAEAEVLRAVALWEAGAAGDPEKLLNEARVLGMQASLKRDQGDLAGARTMLDRALARDAGQERGHLLINRATVLGKLGEHAEAITALRETLSLGEVCRQPHLAWCLRFNLLFNYCCSGLYSEVLGEIAAFRDLTVQLGYGKGLTKIGWIQGLVEAGLGRPAAAETAFEKVRQDFLACSNHLEVALATLELAVLYQEQGRTTEVQMLARELAPVFRSQRVSEEVLATLVLFREAVEQETLTIGLALQLREDLRRAGGLAELLPDSAPGRK